MASASAFVSRHRCVARRGGVAAEGPGFDSRPGSLVGSLPPSKDIQPQEIYSFHSRFSADLSLGELQRCSRGQISSACPVHMNRAMAAAPYLVSRYESVINRQTARGRGRGGAQGNTFPETSKESFKENLIRSVIKRRERLIDKHTHRGGNHRLMIKGGDEQKKEEKKTHSALVLT